MMETVLLLLGVFSLAFLAFAKKKLTVSGAVAAWIVGSLVAMGLKWCGLFLLGIFFVSSTWLGTLSGKKENEVIEKGNTRDAAQVLANGGIAAILACVYLFFPSPILICGFVGCLAAANADTWATELGAFSKNKPFHLLKRQRVEVGTSGAMTILGSGSAFAGSLLIAIASIYFWWGEMDSKMLLLFALTVAGFVGHFVDSLLGAIFQVLYRCSSCQIETESKKHCGVATIRIKGVSWINNDVVNLVCTFGGAILGIIAGLILF
ncbi:DUF92 domain-containing protein [Halalkalibacter alkalisediminis]|uniref:DUF92 domain-containing protein n=1 Tax=Halalkalibacter alkalisediminis TaxID=935616 RepID=A0ABV6NBL4_9BACI|nr:DUF92 domain-containing protein [Halalkalibacter alkalisediminis]